MFACSIGLGGLGRGGLGRGGLGGLGRGGLGRGGLGGLGRGGGGLSSVLGKLGKKPKMSTLVSDNKCRQQALHVHV